MAQGLLYVCSAAPTTIKLCAFPPDLSSIINPNLLFKYQVVDLPLVDMLKECSLARELHICLPYEFCKRA